VSFLEQQNRDDSIVLDLWFDGGQGMIDGVAVHVEQIVLNLLANARQSLRGGGRFADTRKDGWRPRITLTGRLDSNADEERVLLTVADNGGALEDGDLAHAFDPFYSTRDGGRGLGLSICYALATAMGGTLGVHNEGHGQNATVVFTLSLPSATQESMVDERTLCPGSGTA
jgi:signal transduction histidine kinase